MNHVRQSLGAMTNLLSHLHQNDENGRFMLMFTLIKAKSQLNWLIRDFDKGLLNEADKFGAYREMDEVKKEKYMKDRSRYFEQSYDMYA